MMTKRVDLGFLTTHILDTANGCPAKGVQIQLFSLPNKDLIVDSVTNSDGRVDNPLLKDDNFKQGRYELVFHTAQYFRDKGNQLPDPAFLDDVIIRFGISDENDHYHVPLLVSPWSFSTYRGS